MVVHVAAPGLLVVIQVGVEDTVRVGQALDAFFQPGLVNYWRHGLGRETVAVHQPCLNLGPNGLRVGLALFIPVEGVNGPSLEALAALLVGLELNPVAIG